jgi:hypothetical protein
MTPTLTARFGAPIVFVGGVAVGNQVEYDPTLGD